MPGKPVDGQFHSWCYVRERVKGVPKWIWTPQCGSSACRGGGRPQRREVLGEKRSLARGLQDKVTVKRQARGTGRRSRAGLLFRAPKLANMFFEGKEEHGRVRGIAYGVGSSKGEQVAFIGGGTI